MGILLLPSNCKVYLLWSEAVVGAVGVRGEGWLHSDCLFLLISGLPGLGKDSAIKKKQEKNAHAL